MTGNPTACVLIIGNEILSGRTQDSNLNYIAKKLASSGVLLTEARVIPDIEAVIVSTINEMRAKFTYVFTTGGIGGTHDDITAACVAKAFDRPLIKHPEAMRRLSEYYAKLGNVEFNEARQRMAQMPEGSELIDNHVSVAPGFFIGNVYVMAGVPRIMQAMLDVVLPQLSGGPPLVMRTVTCNIREGDLADKLAAIQLRFPSVDIGSYPSMRNEKFITQLVCKGTDAALVSAANDEVVAMVRGMGEEPEVA